MLERDVREQVKSFMEHRGWRAFRTHPVVAPGQFNTCEPGCPDELYLRYEPPGRALVLWVEYKGPNDRRRCTCVSIPNGKPLPRKPKLCKVCRQKAWHDRERKRGATVVEVSDIDAFAEAYERAYGHLHRGEEARGQLQLGITAVGRIVED